MKVVLIQPPIQDFYDTDIRLQPMGLCFLKAALHKYCPDVKVTVRDFHHGWGRTTIPLPKELQYLKEYFAKPNTSPFSSFHQYYHFGLSFDKIAEEVKREGPSLVGISSLFSPYYREVLRCAEVIKTKCSAKIVIGGGQASCSPHLMLGHPAVDFVVLGEGEKPLVELVQAILAGNSVEKISNLGYKNDGGIVLNPRRRNYSFATLPYPDFSDLSKTKYLYKNQPLAFIQSSRGCPHQCSFCSVQQVFGRRYQKRSVDKIIEEMEKRYLNGIRVFDFEDDNLTLDRKQILDLCRRIQGAFVNRPITLLAMNGISYNNLDWEILEQMRKAGFSRLNLALVSADQGILTALNRPHVATDLEKVVENAFSLGFELEVHQIIGLPEETLAGMAKTMALLARLPVLIGVSIFYLTPGTEIAALFPEMAENDIFRSRSTAMAHPTDKCGREDLFTLFTTARILNFIKGLPVEETEINLERLFEFAENDGRTRLGMEIFMKLLAEKKFYTASKGTCAEHQKFNYATFAAVWNGMGTIRTQNGKKIAVD
jgi:radical SAM superfamily enzyme YgiQ (UPF0313 family)